MKLLTHCLWLALAACGGGDQSAVPAATQADALVVQKQKQKEMEICPADGILPQATQPDGSVAVCVPGMPIPSPAAGSWAGGG